MELKDLVLRAISRRSRTLDQVRNDLRRNIRQAKRPWAHPLFDDSDDVEGLVALVADELQVRGITPSPIVISAPETIRRVLFTPRYQIRLHAIVTSPKIVFDPAAFVGTVTQLNDLYAPGNIEFLFDPAKDFEIILDTKLDQDADLLDHASLENLEDEEPVLIRGDHHRARRELAQRRLGKLVLYFSIGTQVIWDDRGGRWVFADHRSYAESGGHKGYVAMCNAVPHPNDLAHEIGHYLHLPHTFGARPENVTDAAAIIKARVEGGWPTVEDGAKVFDGDADWVTDTPPDPGEKLFANLFGDVCGANATVSVPVNFDTLPDKTYEITPDRGNLMSYFHRCGGMTHGFSEGQHVRMRASLSSGNHRELIADHHQHAWIPPIPAQVSWGEGRLDLFAIGGDACLYHKHWTEESSSLAGWGRLGGYIDSVAVASWGSGRLDIFARSIDGALLHKSFGDGGWSPSQLGWESLGDGMASAPAVVSWGPNRLDIVARGEKGDVLHKAWTGTAWSPSKTRWDSLGGTILGAPSITSWGADRLDIVARDGQEETKGRIIQKSWDGKGWDPSKTKWHSLGSNFPGRPVITSGGANRLDIVVRGWDERLWHKVLNAKGWEPPKDVWTPLGGRFTGDPAIISWGPERLDIVVRGIDGGVWYRSRIGSSWLPKDGFYPFGGDIIAAPVIGSWGPNRLDILARSSTGAIYHKCWDGMMWTPDKSAWTVDEQIIEG